MNSTEKVVESYFRLCKNCFTMPDVKVINGNNRQIDLLAYNLCEKTAYHVETSVTHCVRWCPTPELLIASFEKKFFGKPTKKDGPNTDYAKGKSYENCIFQTYKSVGLSPEKIKRIWVCWTVNDNNDELGANLRQYILDKGLEPYSIQIISFRDEIIPALLKKVSTSNYEDDMLRALSLIQQFNNQSKEIQQHQDQSID